MTGKRHRAESAGRKAEIIALIYLLFKGYWPIALRSKTPLGEVDVIARRWRTLIFVEVKWRLDHQAALAAVTPRQAQRMVAAARYWLSTNSRYRDHFYRFDIVAVSPYQLPIHIENAFSEDLF